MRISRSDMRLIQEALELYTQDAEFELEIHSDNEAICRWATEAIEQAEAIYQKLNVVIDTITNLSDRSCDADIVLTPALAKL